MIFVRHSFWSPCEYMFQHQPRNSPRMPLDGTSAEEAIPVTKPMQCAIYHVHTRNNSSPDFYPMFWHCHFVGRCGTCLVWCQGSVDSPVANQTNTDGLVDWCSWNFDNYSIASMRLVRVRRCNVAKPRTLVRRNICTSLSKIRQTPSRV